MAGDKLGPFPLQTNLRKLKPSLARFVPILAGAGILFADDDLWKQVAKWLETPAGWIGLALFVGIVLFLLADLFLKQVYYNERGVGIAKAFGGQSKWYSFDELDQGQFDMGRKKRTSTALYRPVNRLTLRFHTGTVRLWPELYDGKGITDLTTILSRKFPDQYGVIELKDSKKKKLQEQKAKSSNDKKKKSGKDPGSSAGSKKPLPYGSKKKPAGRKAEAWKPPEWTPPDTYTDPRRKK